MHHCYYHWAHINRQKLQKLIKEHNQEVSEQLGTGHKESSKQPKKVQRDK